MGIPGGIVLPLDRRTIRTFRCSEADAPKFSEDDVRVRWLQRADFVSRWHIVADCSSVFSPPLAKAMVARIKSPNSPALCLDNIFL